MLKSFLNPKTAQIILKRFAGHSKWANIKHTKALKDSQRANLFTKLSRQIKVAIIEGGSPDPKFNIKLEQVIEQTRRANMPAATVQSVIKSSQVDKNQCKSYTLEIKGPGSCIILCDVFTDNLHHLKQTIATILKKSKFSDGGGKHLFEQKGLIETSLPTTEKDVLEVATDHAIESGAEDVKVHEDSLQFTCAASQLKQVTNALEQAKYEIFSSSVEHIALREQNLSDLELEQYSVLYEKLENLPEVVKLSDNVA